MAVNILITGGSGFVGRNLAKFFSNKGYTVLTPDRQELKLESHVEIGNFLTEKKIDIVLHCAFEGVSWKDANESTVYKNLQMFENFVLNKDKFKLMINYGSGVSTGEYKTANPYAIAKYIINERIKGINSNIVDIRCWGITGDGELPSRFIEASIRNVLNNMPIVINENKDFDYVTTGDLCRITSNYIASIEENWFSIMPKTIDLVPNEKQNLFSFAWKISRAFNELLYNVKIHLPREGTTIKGLPYVGNGDNLARLNFKLEDINEHIKERVRGAIERQEAGRNTTLGGRLYREEEKSRDLEKGRLGKIFRPLFRW